MQVEVRIWVNAPSDILFVRNEVDSEKERKSFVVGDEEEEGRKSVGKKGDIGVLG